MKRKTITKSLWIAIISLFMATFSLQQVSAAQTTFQLDASDIIASGEFNPSEDFLDIAGSMNDWLGGDEWILEPVGDSIYEIEMPEFPNGEFHEFKFRINGNWDTAEFPAGGNRGYTFLDNHFAVQFVWNVYGYTLIEGVEFDASETSIPVGSSIDFTNLSAGDIMGYTWTFEGGTPGTSSDENPSGITYDDIGTFDVILEVTFIGGDSYTLTKSDHIEVYGEFQTVTFQLDATPILESGDFNPEADFIDVAGSMNDWMGGDDWILSVTEDTTIYEVSLPNAQLGVLHQFKFRINGNWDTAEFPDFGDNRMYTIKENENIVRFIWNVYGFTDRSPKDVIFQLDASEIIASGEFDPANDFLDIAGDMNGWSGGNDWILDPAGDSIFEIMIPGYNVNDFFEFKFRINGDWATSELQGQGNRGYTIKQNENIIMYVWNVYGYELIEGILFDASNTQVVMGETLDYTDTSVGNAQSWQWYFERGYPTSSTDQNPTGILYNDLGMYNVSLVVEFARSGSATYTKQEYINVIAEPKDVMFQLDVTSILQSGEFNPDEDFLDIAGTMNDWNGGDDWILSPTEDTTIYEVLLPDVGVGVTYEFKFRINGDWATAEFPDGGNRSYTIAEEENTVRFVWNVYGYTPLFVTDFIASATDIFAGDAIDFTDLSEGEITGWEWYFEGGTPEQSTDQNPQGIVYDQAGMYDVQLTVFRPSGDSTVIKEDYINVQSDGMVQEYSLSAGYQFVSTRLLPDDPDMTVVLSEILDNRLDFVRSSNGSMLSKVGPAWVNGIGDWETIEGYLFRMNDPADFSIEGLEIDPQTPIDLGSGYQFISYLLPDPMDALDAFATIINDNLDFVRASSGDMITKIGPNWVNNIGNLVPGEGYLVKMNNADQLIYPEMVVKSAAHSKLSTSHFIFEGGNAADPVYTIYLEAGYGVEPGDEVAAFDGDRLIGSTVISANNTFANNLAVFSTLNEGVGYKPGNKLTLKLYDVSENETQHLTYRFADPYGTAYKQNTYPSGDGVYSIVKISNPDEGSELNSPVAIYPNPAKSEVTISSGESIKTIRVYDQTGRLVDDLSVGKNILELNTGSYEPGVYILEIEKQTKRSLEKLIIK